MQWVLLGIVGWVLGVGFVLVLMRMASDQDRAALEEERAIRAMIESRELLERLVAGCRASPGIVAERELDGDPRVTA
jgi:hypothetical protein